MYESVSWRLSLLTRSKKETLPSTHAPSSSRAGAVELCLLTRQKNDRSKDTDSLMRSDFFDRAKKPLDLIHQSRGCSCQPAWLLGSVTHGLEGRQTSSDVA